MIDFKISPGTAGNSDIPQRFEDLPVHDINVFQSENIQNILDAKSKNKEFVEIHYEIKKMDPEERIKLKNLLGEKYFEILDLSFEKCEAQDIEEQMKLVKLALENEDKWHSLIITEKHTTGLLGDETGRAKGSNYHALMRHTNKSEKEGVSGGTFGKGSSVYTYVSGLWMWFAYSVLEEPWKDTKTRFIGRGMIAPYIDREGNRSYDGPLWYARPEDKERDYINGFPQQGLPFTNENAHNEAEKFGLLKRNENDAGTTYLIPVFWPDGIELDNMNPQYILKQLKLEIVKRWFVPIYNEYIKCYLYYKKDDLEIKLEKEDLKAIPELKYKIEILEWYNGNSNLSNKLFRRKEIKIELPILTKSQQDKIALKYGKKLGHKQNKVSVDLIVRELNEEESSFKGFLDSDEDSVGTVNRVALIRNKGMIVNHYPYEAKNKQEFLELAGEKRFEAILFAGKMCKIKNDEEKINHTELFLSYAENPAHNQWIHSKDDLHKCNLRRFSENPTPYPVNRIRYLFNTLSNIIAELFPKDDKPPVRKDICSFWKKLYKLPTSGAESGGESVFIYETLDEGFNNEGSYHWKFKVASKFPESDIKLVFRHFLNSHEGPIKDPEDFSILGVPEFNELKVYEDGNIVQEVILEYDKELGKGIPKIIEIKTCKITSNSLFKNMEPVLEIIDEKL